MSVHVLTENTIFLSLSSSDKTAYELGTHYQDTYKHGQKKRE